YPRYLALNAGKVSLWIGKDNSLEGNTALPPHKWLFVAATFDRNDFRLYFDGQQVASGKLALGSVAPVLHIAPPNSPAWPGKHFGGKVAELTITRDALDSERVKQLEAKPPDFATTQFEEGSQPWRVQTRGQAGYRAPQDPATMPRSKASVPAEPSPLYRPNPQKPTPSLENSGNNRWTIGGWKLIEALKVRIDGAELSRAGIDTKNWMQATVPGTVLTTMVERGVYPDPDYGLNNLAIPESLNKQDYWYRTEFKSPSGIAGRKLTLRFEGINYKAEVWLNGQELGTIKGAFIRGVFDVSNLVQPG